MLNQWMPASQKRDLLADLKSLAAGLKLQQVGEILAAAVIIIPLLIAATHAVQVTVTGGDSRGNGEAAISGTGAITTYIPSDPPGHQRVDGKPGDRTASYCNDDNVGVYLVLPDGSGVPSGQFNFDDLKAAGSAGVTHDLQGFGTVSAVMDAQGNVYIAWNSPNFGANGQGDYAKSFKC